MPLDKLGLGGAGRDVGQFDDDAWHLVDGGAVCLVWVFVRVELLEAWQ